VAAVVVILYTCTGGLLADVVTDLVQGVVIIIGLAVILVALLVHPVVDVGAAWTSIPAEKFRIVPAGASSWAVADLWLMTVCGSAVAQEIMARALAGSSASVARRSAIYGGGVYLVVGLVPGFLGLVGAQIMPGLADPEHLLPEMAERFLPPFAHILFLGALVSAILSTVDSTLLAAASLTSHNVIVSFRPETSDQVRLRLARLGVVVFGVIAYGLALGSESIFELVQLTNGFGSSGIFVLLVFGLFSGWGGPRTAAATLAVGVGIWGVGTFVFELASPFLSSIAAALSVFLVGSWWERGSRGKPAAGATGASA
jgi:Na+/proline symporter